MCTVVYAPLHGGCMLASLRDENPSRAAAIPPARYQAEAGTYVMPKDPMGGGSWAGFNQSGSGIVLLNGAFEAHEPGMRYAMSRGMIVRKLLESAMPVVEWMLMPMQNIEPYTLLVFTDNQLFRLTWDGQQKHRLALDTKRAHIFSSATLYEEAARKHRQELFDNWVVMDPPLDRLSLMNFFKSVKNEPNTFLIDRGDSMKTISYSYLDMSMTIYSYYYYDLQRYEVDCCTLSTSNGLFNNDIDFNIKKHL